MTAATGRLIFLLYTCVVVAGCAASPERLQQYVSVDQTITRLAGIERVLIADTDVTLLQQRFADDPRPLLEQQTVIAGKIRQQLISMVRTMGKETVVPSSGSQLETRFITGQLLDTHALLSVHYPQNRLPNLGVSVNRISEPLSAEAILLSRYRSWSKTDAQWLKDRTAALLRTIASFGLRRPEVLRSQSELEIVLIDGIDGQVLWRMQLTGSYARIHAHMATTSIAD